MRTATPHAPRDAGPVTGGRRASARPPCAASADVLPCPPFAVELVLRGRRRLLDRRARLGRAMGELAVEVLEDAGDLPEPWDEQSGLLARGQDLHDLLAALVLAGPLAQHRLVERRLVGGLDADLVALGSEVGDERGARRRVGAVLEHPVLVGAHEDERRIAL